MKAGACLIAMVLIGLLGGCGESKSSAYCEHYGGQGKAAQERCERELANEPDRRQEVEEEVKEIEGK
jgi:hypothetical protein